MEAGAGLEAAAGLEAGAGLGAAAGLAAGAGLGASAGLEAGSGLEAGAIGNIIYCACNQMACHKLITNPHVVHADQTAVGEASCPDSQLLKKPHIIFIMR